MLPTIRPPPIPITLVSDAIPVTHTGTNGLPKMRILPTGGGTLELEFIRRKGTNAVGLTYVPQFSGVVAGPWVSGQTPVVVSINADWERVTVRDSVAGGLPQRFGKVGLTLVP